MNTRQHRQRQRPSTTNQQRRGPRITTGFTISTPAQSNIHPKRPITPHWNPRIRHNKKNKTTKRPRPHTSSSRRRPQTNTSNRQDIALRSFLNKQWKSEKQTSHLTTPNTNTNPSTTNRPHTHTHTHTTNNLRIQAEATAAGRYEYEQRLEFLYDHAGGTAGPFTGGAVLDSSSSKTSRRIKKEIEELLIAQHEQMKHRKLQKQFKQQTATTGSTINVLDQKKQDDEYDKPYRIHQIQFASANRIFHEISNAVKKTLPIQAEYLSNVWKAASKSSKILGEWASESREEVLYEQNKRKRLVEEHNQKLSMARVGGVQREQRCYKHIKKLEAHLKNQEQVIASLRDREQRLVQREKRAVKKLDKYIGEDGDEREEENDTDSNKERWEIIEEKEALQDRLDTKDRRIEMLELEMNSLRQERNRNAQLLERLMGADVDGVAAAEVAVKDLDTPNDEDENGEGAFVALQRRQQRTTTRIELSLDIIQLRNKMFTVLEKRRDVFGFPNASHLLEMEGTLGIGDADIDQKYKSQTTLADLEETDIKSSEQIKSIVSNALFPEVATYPLVVVATQMGGFEIQKYHGVVRNLQFILRTIRRIYSARKDYLCDLTAGNSSELELDPNFSHYVMDVLLKLNEHSELLASKFAIDLSVSVEYCLNIEAIDSSPSGEKENDTSDAEEDDNDNEDNEDNEDNKDNANGSKYDIRSYSHLDTSTQKWIRIFRNFLVDASPISTCDFLMILQTSAHECSSKDSSSVLFPMQPDLGFPYWITETASHLLMKKVFQGLPGSQIESIRELRQIKQSVGLLATPVSAEELAMATGDQVEDGYRLPLQKLFELALCHYSKLLKEKMKTISNAFDKIDIDHTGKINGKQFCNILANMEDTNARSLLRHVKLQAVIRIECKHLQYLESIVVPVIASNANNDCIDPTASESVGKQLDLHSVLTIMERLGYFLRPFGYVLREQTHRFDSRQLIQVHSAASRLLLLIEKEVISLAEWLGSLRRLREKSDLLHVMDCFRIEISNETPPGRVVNALRKILTCLDKYQVLAQQFTGEQTSSNIDEEGRLQLAIINERKATGRAIRMNIIRQAGGEDPHTVRAKYLDAVSFLGNKLKMQLRKARTRILAKKNKDDKQDGNNVGRNRRHSIM